MKNYRLIIFLFLLVQGCSAQNQEKVLINGKDIPIFDATNEFFHDSIKKRLVKADTTLTPEHMLAYTYYIQQTAPFNPKDLDEKAESMYQLNEKGEYQDALRKGYEILVDSPNNITALKEMGYAFKRLGQNDSVQIYFVLMVKAIEGAKLSGDGGAKSPYVLNNWFELRSLIEATTGLYASGKYVYKDKDDRIVGFAVVESPKMGRFGLLDHWSKYLKKGEYLEGALPGEGDMEKQLREEFNSNEK
jgi:hypothetical protein